ncbi:hypothetical protein EJB05_50510, partial [Eragrostis curvula]
QYVEKYRVPFVIEAYNETRGTNRLRQNQATASTLCLLHNTQSGSLLFSLFASLRCSRFIVAAVEEITRNEQVINL